MAGHAWVWVGLFFLPDIVMLAVDWKDKRQTRECESSECDAGPRSSPAVDE